MKILADTHILLWAAGMPDRLPAEAAALLDAPEHEPVFSAASIWEVAIKQALGRPDFSVDPRLLRRGLLDNGWRDLAVDSAHAAAVLTLPALHRDPFDRLLVAQAQVEGMLLLTCDEQVAAYPGPIRKV